MNIKKNIGYVLTLTLALIISICSIGIAGAQEKDVLFNSPIVPIGTVVQGRQAIAQHLLLQNQQYTFRLVGRSVVGHHEWNFDYETLHQMGYKNHGSFVELINVIGDMGFGADIIKTPEGYYDVRIQLEFKTADGRLAFEGWGYLDIRELPDGSLQQDRTFNPYFWMNSQLAVQFNGCVNSVMWVPNDGGMSEYVPLMGMYDGSLLAVIQSRMFQRGILAVADCMGQTYGWNLKSGEYIEGKRLVAYIGDTRSGEFIPVYVHGGTDDMTINVDNYVQFQRYNGDLIGRMPVVELVVSGSLPFKGFADLSVSVWPTRERIRPMQVFVTPVALVNGETPNHHIGVEVEVPMSDGQPGLSLPPGKFQLRTVFKGLRDWDEFDGKG